MLPSNQNPSIIYMLQHSLTSRLTAWQALVEVANVVPGQTVLIHAAAGGVGHVAVQLSKILGATTIGTAMSISSI